MGMTFKPPLPNQPSKWDSVIPLWGTKRPRFTLQWICELGYEQAKSEKGAAAHLVFVIPPDHDVSVELRDIQREHGETNTLVCCPVKVCLFWPECT